MLSWSTPWPPASHLLRLFAELLREKLQEPSESPALGLCSSAWGITISGTHVAGGQISGSGNSMTGVRKGKVAEGVRLQRK